MMPSAKLDEKTLLAMVATGNREAFTQLYIAHLNYIYRYIFLFTKSKGDTEEILQEIFIKIWESRDKLPEVESFKNYLCRSAKNKILDNIRHLQTRQRVHAEIKRTRDISETTTSDQCTYREYYHVVQQAIEKLPPKRKIIFRLTLESGLSPDEIALQLNISKSVVQKQTYKASHFVRQYFLRNGQMSVSIVLILFLSVFLFSTFF